MLEFRDSLTCLVQPAVDRLDERLGSIPGLKDGERVAVSEGVTSALYRAVHDKVCRVLLLELNAARVDGRLTAADSAGRWSEFLEASARPRFWDSLARHYPTLLPRLHTLIDHRCAAALVLARRLASDRSALVSLLDAAPGELTEVTFGAGDSHRGGQSVAILTFTAGRIVYKPRSVQVDEVLAGMLTTVLRDVPPRVRIRVPDVVPRGEYGWARYVVHEYCADAEQLACFYRGIGHWLAVMRLLGGSDLHAENLIACGPVPVVVDCETLFSPQPSPKPSGFGLAFDRAGAMVARTVLSTGLLPSRGVALGWRGVDASAAGSLPGQQPPGRMPVIVNAGSDLARLGFESTRRGSAASHPSPEPAPAEYWDRVLEGFDEVTASLKKMDQASVLEPLLDRFADCPIRVVTRATETYAELSWMLWHPVSLHNESSAVTRAGTVLSDMAEQHPRAPDDPQVIAAEIAELLIGDIPYFTTSPRKGRLVGPGGTAWLPEEDQVATALQRWRGTDSGLEHQVMQTTLMSAYLNDDWMLSRRPLPTGRPSRQRLDQRRRTLARDLLTRLRDSAIHGDDGTVTWIAPVPQATGWAVAPLGLDIYAGLPGIAVLLAGYLREVVAGRADEVSGIPALFDATMHSIRTVENEVARLSAKDLRQRPVPPGAYVGLGSRIWAWLILHRLGADGGEGLDRARTLALELPCAIPSSTQGTLSSSLPGTLSSGLSGAISSSHRGALTSSLRGVVASSRPDPPAPTRPGSVASSRRDPAASSRPGSVAVNEESELLAGTAGAIIPLLHLADATGERQWIDQAVAIGDRLIETARWKDETAYWPSPHWPNGLGGLSHGVTGIGWSLARLALAVDEPRFTDIAAAAFAFEDALYEPTAGGWLDLRYAKPLTVAAWCHGAVGIGLVAADLTRRGWPVQPGLLARATAAAHRGRLGWNHSLCHGDLGSWEFLREGHPSLTADVISGIERHGPVTGHASTESTPGLLAGTGGIVYQLMRIHPGCGLPSLLTLEV